MPSQVVNGLAETGQDARNVGAVVTDQARDLGKFLNTRDDAGGVLAGQPVGQRAVNAAQEHGDVFVLPHGQSPTASDNHRADGYIVTFSVCSAAVSSWHCWVSAGRPERPEERAQLTGDLPGFLVGHEVPAAVRSAPVAQVGEDAL